MAQNKNWFQSRAEFALAGALMNALRILPAPAAQLSARAATRTLDVMRPKLRRVARTNLSFAYPDLDHAGRERMIDGVFASIARMLFSLARFPHLNVSNIRDWISYDGLDNYLSAKAVGRGVLIATAHLGNWELSAFAHALMTEPMNIMVRPLDNPLIDSFVENRRTLSGNRLIYKKDAARAVIKALKNNEAVGILIDQNTSPSEGVFINFFGKPACAGSAFAKLAHHTGAPVIPGFAVWDKAAHRYVLRFYPQIEMTGDEAVDTRHIHSTLEQIIRQYPDQWMWIHRRWKTRPAGEPPLY
ncbi:MAG TPA: lysophospholipid acyltransferase family protein [Bryobacteraceae bacterium]|nr:lysophospholipid acyltransferase family protein [Bryobacteraceae bacterium]